MLVLGAPAVTRVTLRAPAGKRRSAPGVRRSALDCRSAALQGCLPFSSPSMKLVSFSSFASSYPS
jgi:hypothetical protein